MSRLNICIGPGVHSEYDFEQYARFDPERRTSSFKEAMFLDEMNVEVRPSQLYVFSGVTDSGCPFETPHAV